MDQAGRRSDLMDILDRVLDKGIVIDAGIRIAVIGIDLISLDAKITVTSIETYLQLADDSRVPELGLIRGRRHHSTEDRDDSIGGRSGARAKGAARSAAAPGAGAPAPAHPSPPLAAFQDEKLSMSQPEETESGEQE